MSKDPAATELRVAKRLEASGRVDEAVRVYCRADRLDEAVRVLLDARRPGDAASLLERAVGKAIETPSQMNRHERGALTKAAALYASAGQTEASARLYLVLGDKKRAAAVYERAGDVVTAARIRDDAQNPRRRLGGDANAEARARAQPRGNIERLEREGKHAAALQAYLARRDYRNAGRMAATLGRFTDAAELFSRAACFYEAAQCLAKAGDPGRALDVVVRVARDDPRYRRACVLAATLASNLRVLDFALDHFLRGLVESGPRTGAEVNALYELAQLYTAHDFPESALEAYQGIAEFEPGHRDVQDAIARLEHELRGSPMVQRQIDREDRAFLEASVRRRSGSSVPPPRPDTGSGVLGIGSTTASTPPTRVLDDVPLPASAQHPAPAALGSHAGPAPALLDVTALPAETVIADRYEIVRTVGQGGMATVYEARYHELDERVALKFYTAGAPTAELLERFKRELALSRRLSHPNIVQVFDIGAYGGARFMSMELLIGSDLAERLADGVSLPRACEYVRQAALGLHAAHAHGVVHRDVKPENFFVTTDDVVKLMDFGIAKKGSAPSVTRTGFIAGTPEYIAPEQVNDFSAVDHRADIYALGCIAYEALTGSLPFDAPELLPLIRMHLEDAPEPLRSRNPSVPVALEALVLAMLAKAPDARPASCEEVAERIARFAALTTTDARQTS